MMSKYRPLPLLVIAIAFLSSGCVATIPLLADKPPPVSAHEGVSVNQIDIGVVISISNANIFDSGQHTLKPSAETFLKSLSNTLNNKTGSRILIEVNPDHPNGASGGIALSEQRANTLRHGLASRGTPLIRITTVSSGSRPLITNNESPGSSFNDRTAIVLIGELIDNISGDGSFFRDIGNQTSAAAVGVRLAIDNTTILAKKYNPPLRSRYVGDVTQCPASAAPLLIVIDGSSIAPGGPIPGGTDIQHLVQTQLCLRTGSKRNVEQAVSVMQNGNTVFTSPKFVHSSMYRSRQQFISTLSVPKGAPAGAYEVESLIVLDGRTFRQSTPFEVR